LRSAFLRDSSSRSASVSRVQARVMMWEFTGFPFREFLWRSRPLECQLRGTLVFGDVLINRSGTKCSWTDDEGQPPAAELLGGDHLPGCLPQVRHSDRPSPGARVPSLRDSRCWLLPVMAPAAPEGGGSDPLGPPAVPVSPRDGRQQRVPRIPAPRRPF
jgi:hypothetical protein